MVSFVINRIEYVFDVLLANLIALFLALINGLVVLSIQGVLLSLNYENYAIASLDWGELTSTILFFGASLLLSWLFIKMGVGKRLLG